MRKTVYLLPLQTSGNRDFVFRMDSGFLSSFVDREEWRSVHFRILKKYFREE